MRILGTKRQFTLVKSRTSIGSTHGADVLLLRNDGVDGLQLGGAEVVWLGATHDLGHYEQLNARLARPGQKADTVVVHRILAADTIEEDIACGDLVDKSALQNGLLDAVKKRNEKPK